MTLGTGLGYQTETLKEATDIILQMGKSISRTGHQGSLTMGAVVIALHTGRGYTTNGWTNHAIGGTELSAKSG